MFYKYSLKGIGEDIVFGLQREQRELYNIECIFLRMNTNKCFDSTIGSDEDSCVNIINILSHVLAIFYD